MADNNLPREFLHDARLLVPAENDLLASSIGEFIHCSVCRQDRWNLSYDLATRFEHLLATLEYDQTGYYRPLFSPLKFINQHAGLLRHTAESPNTIYRCPVKLHQIGLAIKLIADVIVAVGLIWTTGHDVGAIYKNTVKFYNRYYELAIQHAIDVPVKETFFGDESSPPEVTLLLTAPTEPPQMMTIAWYKSNGWRNFLKTHSIIPQDHVFVGSKCSVERYNGTTTLLKRNGVFRFIRNDVIIKWV